MRRLFFTLLSFCILSLFSLGSVYSMDMYGDLDMKDNDILNAGDVNVGASTLATRSLTVDTGGVFDINLGTAAGDDFTVDTSAFVVEGDTGDASMSGDLAVTGNITAANLAGVLAYGVTWDEDNTSPTLTRTGALAGIAAASSPGNAALSIQSAMRRCVLNDAGAVVYYLCGTD